MMKDDLAKIHSAKSAKEFPWVSLEDGEYVELYVKRSKWGLILIWAGELVGFVGLIVVLVLMSQGKGENMLFGGLNESAMGYLYLMIFSLFLVLLLSGWVGTVVYRANSLLVTNKRAMQRSTISLFARNVNVIELKSIEDVSFSQETLFERIFHMGTIRLSTVGDETTYTFPYVDTPTDEMKKITSLVHKAKEKKKKKTTAADEKTVDKKAKA